MSLLRCVKLTKIYKHNNILVKILDNINLNVETGQMIAIIGASGSGKTTLLHLLAGLDVPNSGKVYFEGNLLHKFSDREMSKIRNQKLGFIYQFYHLLSDFSISENIAIPLLIKGTHLNQVHNKVLNMLELVGLKNYASYYPHELSGGEMQRVAIARAIINNPSLVLADEPTGNLDKNNSDNIFKLLKMLNIRFNTTFLIATHDLNIANQCHKIYTIINGKLK